MTFRINGRKEARNSARVYAHSLPFMLFTYKFSNLQTLITLYNFGLDVYFYLNALHIILGLPIISRPDMAPIQQSALINLKFNDAASNKVSNEIRFVNMDAQSRTLISFFEQLKDALPIEEMGEIYYDKMENDEVLIVSNTHNKIMFKSL